MSKNKVHYLKKLDIVSRMINQTFTTLLWYFGLNYQDLAAVI